MVPLRDSEFIIIPGNVHVAQYRDPTLANIVVDTTTCAVNRLEAVLAHALKSDYY